MTSTSEESTGINMSGGKLEKFVQLNYNQMPI